MRMGALTVLISHYFLMTELVQLYKGFYRIKLLVVQLFRHLEEMRISPKVH